MTEDLNAWLDGVERRANDIANSGGMGAFDWGDMNGVSEALSEANGDIPLLCQRLRAALKVVEAATEVYRGTDNDDGWQRMGNALAAFRALSEKEGRDG